MSSWNQPICERDWIAQHSSVGEVGMLSIDRPVRLKDAMVEQCAFCGHVTIFGVYVRVDPDTVPFPTKHDS
jgi:hypothetical protein